LPKQGSGDNLVTKMSPGPIETVKFKTSEIPIYSELHHGKKRYLIAYYADGVRRRERFQTFDDARKKAKVKAQELAKGTAHVGNFTPAETATIKAAIELLRGAGAKLLPAVQEYAEARKILGNHGLLTPPDTSQPSSSSKKRKPLFLPSPFPNLPSNSWKTFGSARSRDDIPSTCRRDLQGRLKPSMCK
jgi:hypothetical protein